ncbi:hypothetical protein CJD36_020040 [Flavipsychrobacter stenotrophus]|uniref:ORC1/DEAH AAA+ ATPase domain-containing protein n=1 Tax=Flavipsychrobacter stenotrophus TaxID=2077091 RepID=A0A2S7SSC1_9BACT|nr:AAA family ATPase [Flavipsychrobacter stenotrophus]PQJ09531.1 hypothetical protein CJD36_020040 [Flavipsychrobacter stenotrophus]
MQITQTHKQMVAKAIAEDLKMRQHSDSGYKQANHAQYLQINPGSYSRISKGDIDKVLSEVEWVRIGKKLFCDLSENGWKTARTAVFGFVTAQLSMCQQDSLSAINCDLVGIGKTHSAEVYAATHQNVIYVKCRQGITRADLLREMAQNLGLEHGDQVRKIRERVELELLRLQNPLVVLDDAGYMNDNCWMEIKGLYDVTEGGTGWYIIGDDTLGVKINKMLAKRKLGWEALFDRFNRKFQAITEQYDSEASVSVMRKETALQILQLNLPEADTQLRKDILTRSGLSLRVLRKEVAKHKRMNATKKAA